ncbi:MAG: hypothetical protein WDN31_19170 [Hyphomicrobium sp.]
MTPWLAPPIVISLGLVLMIIAVAIYRASRPMLRPQPVARKTSSKGTSSRALTYEGRA